MHIGTLDFDTILLWSINQYINLKVQQGGKKKNAEFISENDIIKISFFPKLYKVSSETGEEIDLQKIEANEINVKIIINFLKSQEWKEFLKYNLDELRPYVLPYYTPEMYYVDKIRTYVENEENRIKIVITGIIKKHSYEEVKKKYMKSDAINKTWSDKIKNKMTMKHLKDLIYDGFWKWTTERGMLINKMGYVKFDDPSEIKIKVSKLD